jgi:hypothetical protein
VPRKIFIESKPVSISFGQYYHSYLVYEDEEGNEFVIRGGPAVDNPKDFGSIITEPGIAMDKSEDKRSKSEREIRGQREIDLGGRDASDVWEQMKEVAGRIPDKNYSYIPIGIEDNEYLGKYYDSAIARNSNSATSFILKSVGIDSATHLPLNATWEDLPGFDDPLPNFDNDDYYGLPLEWR